MTIEEVATQYDNAKCESIASYKIITKDSRGLLLDVPYVGVSINGSEYIDTNRVREMSDSIDNDWTEFSKIQHATWMVQTEEAIERFWKWRVTRNDEDAWG